jgi:hypothetical protein
LVQVNRVLIETGVVPPSPLDTSVRYKRERSGLEEWDNAKTCIERGWGDCEDLAAWECAGINLDEDPEAICVLIRTGPKLFHCVVMMSDGTLRDICPDLGMKVPGTQLEGLPWFETRGENIIGASRAMQRTLRKVATKLNPIAQAAAARRPTSNAPAYRPRPSSQTPSSSRSDRGGSEPYRPKSSRPSPTNEPDTQMNAPSPVEMVSPTSTQNPAMDLSPMPMQEYPEDEMFDLDQIDAGLDDEGEEFDEEIEDAE